MKPLPVLSPSQLPLRPPERIWLIEHLWANDSVGLLGGPPKSLLCGAPHKSDYAASRIMLRHHLGSEQLRAFRRLIALLDAA